MTTSLSDAHTAASMLGMPSGLFHSAFALNDHGFALLGQPDTSPNAAPGLVYANPAYLRLAGCGSPEDLRQAADPVPAAARNALPTVLAERVPASYVGYEPSWQRWVHLYLFPAADRMAGAFVADPGLLSHEDAGLRRSPADFGDLQIDFDARRVLLRGEPVPLTRTEYDLLALLAQAPNRVVTRPQAIRALWDTSWLGSSPALDVHVSRLRRKLGESGANPRYVHSIRGSGLIFIPDKDP